MSRRPTLTRTIIGSLALGLLSAGYGQRSIDWSPPLPPALPWSAVSEALIVPANDPWITPSERSGLTNTPTYAETIAWLNVLAEASQQVHLVSLGTSAEGREIWMVVASASGAATASALKRNGRPILLVQAGIHSGEIDGKDAGLMLLRDMTVGRVRADLLAGANFLFIPILSVDAHERRSATNRVNQRGPAGQGWRTNSRNLNLNRDYAKLDTEEIRAVVRAINKWQPDLYLDIHVTDGIDYQYDITFGHLGQFGWSPKIAKWLDDRLTPALTAELKAQGHIPGPLIFALDNADPDKGILSWASTPRYSDGYGAARHLPTVLVENHALKPYRQRVLGTYVLLATAMQTLARYGTELRRAVTADQSREPKNVPLSWKGPDKAQREVSFKGMSWRKRPSDITGSEQIEWTGEARTVNLPVLALDAPALTVRRPKAYWIPPAWKGVISRLALHGIYMETMSSARTVRVEFDRLSDIQFDAAPFEGRMRVKAQTTPEVRSIRFPAGSVRVPTSQPLGDLVVNLLEPQGPDSFFQWGFFLEVLQRTEYVEGYVMEPLAQRMLDADPQLRRDFETALKGDPEMAASPRARLQWFYRRTPYFDANWRLYPVGRER